MNQCQGKPAYYFGSGGRCYAVNASVLPNGEVWCWQHDPAKIAARKRAKALAKAAPALRAVLRDIVDYLVAEPTQTVVPDGRIRDAQAAIAEAEKEA